MDNGKVGGGLLHNSDGWLKHWFQSGCHVKGNSLHTAKLQGDFFV